MKPPSIFSRAEDRQNSACGNNLVSSVIQLFVQLSGHCTFLPRHRAASAQGDVGISGSYGALRLCGALAARLISQYHFFTAPKGFHLFIFEAELLWPAYGLAVAGSKHSNDRHAAGPLNWFDLSAVEINHRLGLNGIVGRSSCSHREVLTTHSLFEVVTSWMPQPQNAENVPFCDEYHSCIGTGAYKQAQPGVKFHVCK